jgi:hypothetical protein
MFIELSFAPSRGLLQPRLIMDSRYGKLCSYNDGTYANPEKEASTGEIHLEEDDPEIVELMINFLYNGNYVLPSTLTAKPGTETAAQSSVRLTTPASGNTTPKSPIFGAAATGQQGTASGAHPPTNLFGAAPSTTAAASTATAGGLFSTGGITAAPFGTATGGLFGNNATANPSGSGLFGILTMFKELTPHANL